MSNKQENYQLGHIKTAQTQPNITATLLIQPLPVTGHLGNKARNLGSVWQMKCPWITFPVLSSSFFLHSMCYAFQDFLCPTHFQRSSFHSKVNSITLHLNLVVFSLFSPHSLIHLLILDLLMRGENTHRLSATLLPVYILRSSNLFPDNPLELKHPVFCGRGYHIPIFMSAGRAAVTEVPGVVKRWSPYPGSNIPTLLGIKI